MSELTDRIDLLLNERGIKRAELCRATGIGDSTVRTWIARAAMPSAEAAFKVAQYFGVTVEYLLTGKNPSDASELYISPEESELIDIYRSLMKKDKDILIGVAQLLDKNR